MSLRFYFGPSGSGKSRQLYEEILWRAGQEPDRNFLVIVPDQFTMQTQKDLVTYSGQGGILNIDVLSFGRLSHRILEEVGQEDIPVLDDTGKSLVLQKVAAGMEEELPVLGSFLRRQGYIHEVKSAISEFMQYGIGTEDVSKLIACAGNRAALAQKLKDLEKLYKAFVEYIQGKFITTEGKLEVLRRSLSLSKLLPGSVVAFDGFTGFTPIQNRVIQGLMGLCGEVIVTVTMGQGEDPYRPDGEQRLFHLSKKTVADLQKLAGEAGTGRGKDVFLSGPCHRFRQAPALGYLEQNLFRYGTKPYGGEREASGPGGCGEGGPEGEKPLGQEAIRLFEATTPREEVHEAGLEIRRLIREQDLAYRDVAVILGDLEGYGPHVETEFAKMEIPFFLDRTRGIVLNPMIEFIKSALELYCKNFTYEAVFHYLRSGLASLEPGEVDLLENYVLQTGIRGYGSYSRRFVRKTQGTKEEEEALEKLNGLRQRFMDQVDMLHMKAKQPVREYIDSLYDFLVCNQVQNRLAVYQARFETQGEPARAREYAQIYRLVMELLDQVYSLLGEETIDLQEFADILEAGFGEIQVGTIPQNVDRVVVGDMERTRLRQVKVLFFLGVNDGNIPKNASKGGLISDMDREFLRQSQIELAPSPRQQMYIQRLYLYLNMTKPSHRLYLSYAKINNSGKSIRPSYLIDTVQKLFPGLSTEYPQLQGPLEKIVTAREGCGYLARELREYAAGMLPQDREIELFTIYQAYGTEALQDKRQVLEKAAFLRYQDSGLSAAVARALYGHFLENSVTRLETYAACAYRHFLQYGLLLREREGFSFESVDMGNVYHAVLEQFAGKLTEAGHTWFDFPEEYAKGAVRDILEAYAATYGETVLYSSARNAYAIHRMERILIRTVLTLQSQLKKGSFLPDAVEVSFHSADNLESVHIELSDQEKMALRGRIDRIDVAEDDSHVYVKVIDYKSGKEKFDIAALYYGLQLQLVVYMNAAMELEGKKHPGKEVVPAALLYYHVEDPSVETSVEPEEEELKAQIERQLRMNGVVNSRPEIVEWLDGTMSDKSDVIPVERKKDGTFSARSSVMSREELQVLSDYVSHKVVSIGRQILDGVITLNPYEKGNEEACTYCNFRKVCGFEPGIPGCSKRTLEDLGREEALERMIRENGARDKGKEGAGWSGQDG